MKPSLAFTVIIILLTCSCTGETEKPFHEKQSLAGEWQFAADSLKKGRDEKWFAVPLPETVTLPGTLDENNKGIPNENRHETMRLSRERTYEGWAWYRKTITIPDEWNGKRILLRMERTKPSEVWIDTLKAGQSMSILTPQIHDLTAFLTPGQHAVTILVDNGPGSVPPGITGSHAWTEHTQTNWNGIIGDFCLEASNPDYIKSVKVFPDSSLKNVNVKIRVFSSANENKEISISLKADSRNSDEKHAVRTKTFKLNLEPGINDYEFDYPMGKGVITWSEFNPALYNLSVSFTGKDLSDSTSVNFGMRRFSTAGTQFAINGITTFLRGKHDACVFPLTGHPPMDIDSWRRVFQIAKSYNINFYRFHSWTPPEAAFAAADIEGIYLQPELPFWGGFSKTRNTDLNEFLLKTGDEILENYGNHASFVMFALGNELSGDQEVMKDFLSHFRKTDSRPLMAYGSNNYLGFRGQAEGEDYFAGCRIGRDTDTTFSTHIRASFSFADAYDGGYINARYPSSLPDYSEAISKCTVPALGTEVGQYQIYPDYNEIKKYTGVLKPWNFQVFKLRLEENNLGDQAMDFFKASGALSVLCYRADIEMAMRTPGFGGFHLLDLQDFPGQGTALIGIIDAFMDSKGLITPAEFSHFNNKIVPLFITEKYCLTNNEILKGTIKVANYSEKDMKSAKVSWTLKNSKDETVKEGFEIADLLQGKLTSLPEIEIDLSPVQKAEKVTLDIKIEDSEYENSYPLWIYPSETDTTVPDGIMISDKIDNKTIDVLENGGRVLLFPDFKDIQDQSVGGLFISDYWNYRMFKGISEANKKPVSPGTMGILTDPSHPVFRNFPTEFHSNWQWWPIVKNSRPFILDNTPAGYKPIVQVIDNIERNHKLGLIFEFSVGKGKLLVCMSDLRKLEEKPESRQLYSGLLEYVSSDSFNPKYPLTASDLKKLFSTTAVRREITGVGNISYSHD